MRIHTETNDSITIEVYATDDWVSFKAGAKWGQDNTTFTRDEAIAAARAILKHFNVGVE